MPIEEILAAIRRYWVHANLRNVNFNDRYRSLNAAYRVLDPWGLDSEREHFRFERTNNLIIEHIGHVNTLLEVGCGEGYQSQYLIKICNQLYGIDVSKRAVERAANRCPQGRFEVGSLSCASCISEFRWFDLAVACEVLYYVKDVQAALRQLSECCTWCLVTYYSAQAHRLDPYILANQKVLLNTIRYGKTVWKVALWRNA